MKVILKADTFPLNEQFEPGNEVSNNHTSHDIDFPVEESDTIKKDFVKQLLSQHFTYLPSLYFRCKIFQKGTDNPVFEHEDYFEEKPENRVHIKWGWDKKESIAIGVTYYSDGTIGDPRLLPDWQKTIEKHRKERNRNK